MVSQKVLQTNFAKAAVLKRKGRHFVRETGHNAQKLRIKCRHRLRSCRGKGKRKIQMAPINGSDGGSNRGSNGIRLYTQGHATQRPSLNSSGGTASAQEGFAIGQRVRKAQPDGLRMGLGTSPVS